jgi:phage tail-like protein
MTMFAPLASMAAGDAIGIGTRLAGGGQLGSLLTALHAPLGLAMRFDVVVGGLDLGRWSSCENLDVTMNVNPIRPLGVNGSQQVLLPSVEYSAITLKRAVDSRATPAVRDWLVGELQAWYQPSANGAPYAGQTARITLYDAMAVAVMSWTLWGVYPARWSGPALAAKDPAVAVETLQLVHQGFLDVTDVAGSSATRG